ncbi:YbaB/EbfC family nucleoid-associated protein [Pararhodospirillum oryzae]|uniref:Nucleoid-associated protein ROR02_21320 n=1 Tax=Pararhodospirillum oryzae TaxID=478448 RepID=A0A512H976_9PROT|nr:YbaB/EbfC family nucleoid-associated protein [Pararhodospirillum oryzae]GEO82001.1 nucleoid-associated protein [Pararhodospirillum oryzae]
MKNIGQMLKAAQQMQSRMAEAQEALGAMEITGRSGGGLVEITLTGKGDIKSVTLDPSILSPDEAVTVQDLIIAAFSDAKSRVDEAAKAKISEVTGGLKLPEGMPF